MTAARLIALGLNVSVVLMVFAVALGARVASGRSVLQSPGLLARALVAMYVVMPALAIGIALSFELTHALKVALILLALSPVPPVLPGKQMRVGGSAGFVLGLLVVAAAAAIVVVPAGLAVVGAIAGRDLAVPFGATTQVVATSVLLPVAAGLVVGRFAPRFAERAARPLTLAALVLMLATFVPLLVAGRHALAAQLGDDTVLAMVLFTIAGLAVGHLLGGPAAETRSAVALATATRHPGVALAVLHAIEPGDKAAMAAIVLYLLVATVVATPYVAWRKRAHAGAAAT